MNERLGKADLARAIAEHAGESIQDSTKFVDAFVEVVKKTVTTGGQVSLKGFGVFSTTETKGRKGVNPKTGETIQILPARRPKFAAAQAFKDEVKK
jgi:DNA-binding protein HU-beta